MSQKEVVFQNIYTRRSIRRYSDKEILKEDVLEIIKAGMYAPSAVNKQPWHFIVFNDENTKEKIIELHAGAEMLRNAKVAILVCGDENLAHSPGYIACDCSAATQNILLAAHAKELGAVWIGIYPREERIAGVKGLFELPAHIVPFSVIALGYPLKGKDIPERFKEERIRYEKW